MHKIAKYKINKKRYILKRKKNKNKNKIYGKLMCFLLILIIYIILFIIQHYTGIKIKFRNKIEIAKNNNNIVFYQESKNEENKENKGNKNNKEKIIVNKTTEYFCCFCVMGKMENPYARELIDYYTNLGVDKFVIADNNLPNTEKFSDVLGDYISNGLVDIIDIIGQSYDYSEYYDIMYQKYQHKCSWLAFFDFDEYLLLHSETGEKIKLKEFVSNTKFDKCEAIFFNWLIYGDNDLVYYEKKPTIERFTQPIYNSPTNRFVKTMIRGNLNKTTFIAHTSCHKPNREIKMCNALGEIPDYNPDTFVPPTFKYGCLMHFSTRTAEEYVRKAKRGYAGNRHPKYEERVNVFFSHNKVTEEKVKVFEKYFNQTFPKYHQK